MLDIRNLPRMLDRIKAVTTHIAPRLIEIRRHLHAYPELSGQEHETAAYIAGILSSSGLEVREGVGKTGVVGEIPGQGTDQRMLAIRADMDALPIEERTGLEFASRRPGVMHACGHDVHTTVGLGTAMVLAELQQELPGKIRFIFQPAEEVILGATWMIQDKVLNQITSIIGIHVYPSIPSGSVGIRYGALTAASDFISIDIFGELGDGGEPHTGVDALWIAAQVILSLQQAVRHLYDPLKPVVLTIGTIEGGRSSGLIADRVQLAGTVRSLSPEIRQQLPEKLEEIVARTCNMFGARYQFNYRKGVPSVQNNQFLTQLVERSAREALETHQVQILSEPSLGGEDFSFYLDHCPGTMFRLGVGHTSRNNYPLHHPRFEVDESAIVTGVLTLAYAAYNYWQTR